ncbi:MAG: peptidylprolyl isomerase [Bacteroidales bacterium]|nr:peptidylprolyl isomerase [Bacteroidales bacterium]
MLSCNSPAGDENKVVSIKTSLGEIKVMLYNETPIHRDNFIKMVNSGVYDGVLFHRVINEFMIQAGDPSTNPSYSKPQRDTLAGYTIPAEFRPQFIHKKGALAAARQGNNVNPEMRSSGTQFYIVQGKKYSRNDLLALQEKINSSIRQAYFIRFIKEVADSARLSGKPLQDSEIQEIASGKMFRYLSTNPSFKYTEEQIATYVNLGGTPFLDGTYTVFGEVTEGLDIVDKIAAVSTDGNDKPVN